VGHCLIGCATLSNTTVFWNLLAYRQYIATNNSEVHAPSTFWIETVPVKSFCIPMYPPTNHILQNSSITLAAACHTHSSLLILFAYVFTVSSGRFNLHDMYTVSTKATAVSDSSLWIPIDHNVVTPFHRACNRVPGMFPPTCSVRGTVRQIPHNTLHFGHKVNIFLPQSQVLPGLLWPVLRHWVAVEYMGSLFWQLSAAIFS
jgi:hypothetical protein